MANLADQKQRAYEYIRGQLLSGTLKAGSRVSDYALAKQLNISRPPIREAMGRLESDGLIERIPNFGTFVRKLDRRQIEDLFELRLVLEAHAAERAAEQIDAESLADLQLLCDRMRQMVRWLRDRGMTAFDAETEPQWYGLDLGFHLGVIRASGNRAFEKVVGDYRVMTNLAISVAPRPQQFLRDQAWTWRFHARVLRALRRGDGVGARYWMSAHIEKTRRGVLRAYDRQQQQGEASVDRAHFEATRELVAKLERYGSS